MDCCVYSRYCLSVILLEFPDLPVRFLLSVPSPVIHVTIKAAKTTNTFNKISFLGFILFTYYTQN